MNEEDKEEIPKTLESNLKNKIPQENQELEKKNLSKPENKNN